MARVRLFKFKNVIMQDARWIYRLKSYKKALKQLSNAVALKRQRTLSILEEQGVIQSFEFTHELTWKFSLEQKMQSIYEQER